ncbi:transcriptional regulator-like protein [Pseudarthrobacter chlorophenolicus A6]|uniref:Transcriptional regulator-like protein n=1 Tax=Pseudarthrobacter chlorophenolicus (strain ATCC 700700 / DSM 12829 / CIP 107037 / JCM 12360 / KCTC 9906 / NCIMB 13794 / A6) TaxID=452863 RepID=B8H8M1_PSECP|nr:WYL domain-containing protein [Pseudarthrobacter chlorophenolicus]ACL39899.1 transcriptional regulator-like protein [Pseudarthrobacter chlorophenolicus A6]SDQ91681.1 transcriptional regulator [Pseudarthrobacter chlorophenolicus]
MSQSRTERLLNLLIALLNTRYGLRRSELRQKVYHDESGNDVAFGRMFERDKNDLRQFGFDVETLTDLGWSEDDPATTRYRIGKESNRLPDVELGPEEWTVLLLASQLWERAALGTAAQSALRKLQASGRMADVELPSGVQPRIRPAGQAFDDLVAAMHSRHAVTFPYLAGTTGREEVRTVEPWGLGSRFGQWYLMGYDRARQEPRQFRLSRFTGPVLTLPKERFEPPADFNIRLELARLPELPLRTAVVDVREGRLLALRGRAKAAGAEQHIAAQRPAGAYDRLSLEFRDPEVLAEELASYGPDAVPVAPPELVRAVERRLRAAAAFSASPVPGYAFPAAPARKVRKGTSEDQLKRMLQLVPFLVHNQGLHIQDVAEHFGVSRGELEDDLRILICSGLPEGYPDDLLDIQWEDDHVFITQDLDLKKPVRFTVEEACALLTGLETLNGLPDVAEGGALESVTLKLLAAAGEEGLRAASLSGPEVAPGDATTHATVREAIVSGAQLHLTYLSPQRDAVSERDVDPLRLYSLDNTWYFEAFCHRVNGLRNFRLDRVQDVRPNGNRAAGDRRPAEGVPAKLFTPNDDDTTVTVQLTRQGRGLAEDYYADRTADLPDGGLVAEIRFGNTGWLPMFVAQHGGAVRILEPAGLADAARDWLEAALARYGG